MVLVFPHEKAGKTFKFAGDRADAGKGDSPIPYDGETRTRREKRKKPMTRKNGSVRLLPLALAGLLLCAVSARAVADGPSLTARSAAVVSRGGVLLWGSRLDYQNPPASTTKVMTAVVVCRTMRLDAWATVSRKAERTEPTRVGVRRGEQYRVRDLLYALLMNSGNDVAVCLAENASGTESRFAWHMTFHARRIGARRTVFKTASGLPARGQKTTAVDLTRILREAMRYDVVLDALATRTKTIRSRSGRRVTLRNHNRLLWDRRHPVVLKTGYTRASRHCYVGYIGTRGRDGVFAFLHARKPWDDARALSSFARSGGAKVAFNRKKLDSSAEVLRLQKALDRRGCSPGPADGIFGRKTQAAVERFQKKAGLAVDGLIGPNTLGKLGLSSR